MLRLVKLDAPPEAARPEREVVDDVAIVRLAAAGDPVARAELCERHGDVAFRVLQSVLGPANEIEDLAQEVLARTLAGLGRVQEPAKVRSWMAGIAVCVAREWLRRRARHRLLSFFAEPPDVPARELSPEVSDAVRATFDALDRLPADERLVFALRYVQGMELAEIALACDFSLSTTKRRLTAAEARFFAVARRSPELAAWVAEEAPR